LLIIPYFIFNYDNYYRKIESFNEGIEVRESSFTDSFNFIGMLSIVLILLGFLILLKFRDEVSILFIIVLIYILLLSKSQFFFGIPFSSNRFVHFLPAPIILSIVIYYLESINKKTIALLILIGFFVLGIFSNINIIKPTIDKQTLNNLIWLSEHKNNSILLIDKPLRTDYIEWGRYFLNGKVLPIRYIYLINSSDPPDTFYKDPREEPVYNKNKNKLFKLLNISSLNEINKSNICVITNKINAKYPSSMYTLDIDDNFIVNYTNFIYCTS
jgi:hypothetical protein